MKIILKIQIFHSKTHLLCDNSCDVSGIYGEKWVGWLETPQISDVGNCMISPGCFQEPLHVIQIMINVLALPRLELAEWYSWDFWAPSSHLGHHGNRNLTIYAHRNDHLAVSPKNRQTTCCKVIVSPKIGRQHAAKCYHFAACCLPIFGDTYILS